MWMRAKVFACHLTVTSDFGRIHPQHNSTQQKASINSVHSMCLNKYTMITPVGILICASWQIRKGTTSTFLSRFAHRLVAIALHFAHERARGRSICVLGTYPIIVSVSFSPWIRFLKHEQQLVDSIRKLLDAFFISKIIDAIFTFELVFKLTSGYCHLLKKEIIQ